MSTDGSSSKVNQSAQPSGMPSTQQSHQGGRSSQDQMLFELYARFCELAPKVEDRIKLLGISESVDTAWAVGRMIPVLRARQKAMQSAITQLERAQS